MASGSSEVGERSGRPAAGVTAEQLAQLLGAVKDGLRDELTSLKRELTSERQVADERLLKKLKLEKMPTFKKKAHEKQFIFNEGVSSKVEEATVALSETPPAVEKAKNLLEEGKKLLCERQKLIRIADRSEHGWATVEEYMEDELADNSDDEKRIQKAEVRAGRKLKTTAAKSGKQRKTGTQLPKRFSQPFSKAVTVPAAAAAQIGAAPYGAQYVSVLPHPVVGAVSRTASLGQPLGPCFECGKLGHFRKKCPLLQSNANAFTR